MQRKTFPGVVYLSNPDFCDFEVIFLLMSWNALVCHLPSISFKQHTVPASQQLEEWAMGTAGPSLLCTQVLVRHLYDHSLWQGERRVWVKEESCSIQEDLAFRKQCNSSCLVREQLHGLSATPGRGKSRDTCWIQVRLPSLPKKEPAWSQWMTCILKNMSIRVWTFITEIIFQSIRTGFSCQLQSRK